VLKKYLGVKVSTTQQDDAVAYQINTFVVLATKSGGIKSKNAINTHECILPPTTPDNEQQQLNQFIQNTLNSPYYKHWDAIHLKQLGEEHNNTIDPNLFIRTIELGVANSAPLEVAKKRQISVVGKIKSALSSSRGNYLRRRRTQRSDKSDSTPEPQVVADSQSDDYHFFLETYRDQTLKACSASLTIYHKGTCIDTKIVPVTNDKKEDIYNKLVGITRKEIARCRDQNNKVHVHHDPRELQWLRIKKQEDLKYDTNVVMVAEKTKKHEIINRTSVRDFMIQKYNAVHQSNNIKIICDGSHIRETNAELQHTNYCGGGYLIENVHGSKSLKGEIVKVNHAHYQSSTDAEVLALTAALNHLKRESVRQCTIELITDSDAMAKLLSTSNNRNTKPADKALIDLKDSLCIKFNITTVKSHLEKYDAICEGHAVLIEMNNKADVLAKHAAVNALKNKNRTPSLSTKP
jgi:ribonuclease HI